MLFVGSVYLCGTQEMSPWYCYNMPWSQAVFTWWLCSSMLLLLCLTMLIVIVQQTYLLLKYMKCLHPTLL